MVIVFGGCGNKNVGTFFKDQGKLLFTNQDFINGTNKESINKLRTDCQKGEFINELCQYGFQLLGDDIKIFC